MVIVASVARTTTRTNQLVRVNSKTGRAIARVRTLDSRWARRRRCRQSAVDTRRCHRRRPGQATSDRAPPTGWGCRTGPRCRLTVGSCSSAVTRTYPRDRRRRCSRSHRQWSTSGGGGTDHWSTKQGAASCNKSHTRHCSAAVAAASPLNDATESQQRRRPCKISGMHFPSVDQVRCVSCNQCISQGCGHGLLESRGAGAATRTRSAVANHAGAVVRRVHDPRGCGETEGHRHLQPRRIERVRRASDSHSHRCTATSDRSDRRESETTHMH